MEIDRIVRMAAERAAREKAKSAFLSLDIERRFSSPREDALKYVVAQAFNEAVDAFAQLAETPAHDVASIMKLQNDIRRFSEIEFWLSKAVIVGAEAYRDLDQEVIEAFSTVFSAGDDGE